MNEISIYNKIHLKNKIQLKYPVWDLEMKFIRKLFMILSHLASRDIIIWHFSKSPSLFISLCYPHNICALRRVGIYFIEYFSV